MNNAGSVEQACNWIAGGALAFASGVLAGLALKVVKDGTWR